MIHVLPDGPMTEGSSWTFRWSTPISSHHRLTIVSMVLKPLGEWKLDTTTKAIIAVGLFGLMLVAFAML